MSVETERLSGHQQTRGTAYYIYAKLFSRWANAEVEFQLTQTAFLLE